MPLTQPPRDEDGNVTPHDHDGIGAGDTIIRRISSEWVVRGKNGKPRLSSLAFKPSSGPNGGMSIDLEVLILEDELSPREHVTTPRWTGSIWWPARTIRAQNLMVGFEPLEEDPPHPPNPYHGEVWSKVVKGNKRPFTSSQQDDLRKTADWYVAIDGVAIVEESEPGSG